MMCVHDTYKSHTILSNATIVASNLLDEVSVMKLKTTPVSEEGHTLNEKRSGVASATTHNAKRIPHKAQSLMIHYRPV